MNIWIFNHHAHPSTLPGGTRHHDLGKELVGRGHRVTVFASSFLHGVGRHAGLEPPKRWSVEDVDGVKFVWLRTPPYSGNNLGRVWSMVVYMWRAWRLGRAFPRGMPDVGRPDIVIGSSVHLLAVLAAYRVARRHRARFVMEVRDLWPQTLVDMGALSSRHPLTLALRWLERFLYRCAERIITLLPFAHEYITACGIAREKVVWIPNGVDLSSDFLSTGPDEGREESDFVVMYLGAHGQANALDVLLEAVRCLAASGEGSIRFVLVGSGPEKGRLMAMARSSGLPNVEFRDSVPKEFVPQTLAEADALVVVLQDLPLYRYGVSLNKLFDYMAAAKPIVFAGAPANNPVKDAECGLTVPPRDPEALADAIVRLSQMPREEREAMGKRGRAYVEEHHDIRKLAERLEKVLLDVVHGA